MASTIGRRWKTFTGSGIPTDIFLTFDLAAAIRAALALGRTRIELRLRWSGAVALNVSNDGTNRLEILTALREV